MILVWLHLEDEFKRNLLPDGQLVLVEDFTVRMYCDSRIAAERFGRMMPEISGGAGSVDAGIGIQNISRVIAVCRHNLRSAGLRKPAVAVERRIGRADLFPDRDVGCKRRKDSADQRQYHGKAEHQHGGKSCSLFH